MLHIMLDNKIDITQICIDTDFHRQSAVDALIAAGVDPHDADDAVEVVFDNYPEAVEFEFPCEVDDALVHRISIALPRPSAPEPTSPAPLDWYEWIQRQSDALEHIARELRAVHQTTINGEALDPTWTSFIHQAGNEVRDLAYRIRVYCVAIDATL